MKKISYFRDLLRWRRARETTASLFTLFLITCNVTAQDTSAVKLEETVISANRIAESRQTVAQSVNVISKSAIERNNAPNTAELLQNLGGVFVQRSQQGGGSPVLRGFEASRVLMVVDGVRMNNAIYRTGHLQNVLTVDNNSLERAEVLFGPASTVYGSDALGGAICFYTKKPKYSEKARSLTINPGFMIRYGSVNHEKTAHAELNIGGHRLASFTSFTHSAFDDLRMGKNTRGKADFGLRPYYIDRINGRDSLVRNSDPYLQKYSGYSQYDFLEKISFKQNSNMEHHLNFQFSNSSNIPRYDRLTDPDGTGLRNAEWYYGPQKRLMASYQLNVRNLGWFNNGLRTTLSWQDIDESRNSRRFNRTGLKKQIENVKVTGLTSMAERVNGRNTLRVGADFQYSDVTSVAYEENITTGIQTPVGTRYPDGGSYMADAAGFATLSQNLGKLILSEGARGGFSTMHGSFVNTDLFPFPFSEVSQKSPTGSGHLGLVWLPTTKWKVSAIAATGFRMPNVDDIGKVFDSQAGSLIVPNPDLKPEQTYNLELGWQYAPNSRFRWETSLWNTSFRNAIVTDNFQYNGQDSVVYDDVLSRILANQNKRKANIWGFTTGINSDITSFLTLQASCTYTYGRILQNEGGTTPLDHIPPFFGKISARYHKNKLDAEVYSIFNAKKSLNDYYLNGEDNEQYAPADGMPGWYTLNLRLGYRLIRFVNIQAGVDNITDVQYRNFASGINAPGRNIFVALRLMM